MIGYKHMLEIDGVIQTPYRGARLELGVTYSSPKGFYFYRDKEFAKAFAKTIPQMRVYECYVPEMVETYDGRDFKSREITLIREV